MNFDIVVFSRFLSHMMYYFASTSTFASCSIPISRTEYRESPKLRNSSVINIEQVNLGSRALVEVTQTFSSCASSRVLAGASLYLYTLVRRWIQPVSISRESSRCYSHEQLVYSRQRFHEWNPRPKSCDSIDTRYPCNSANDANSTYPVVTYAVL